MPYPFCKLLSHCPVYFSLLLYHIIKPFPDILLLTNSPSNIFPDSHFILHLPCKTPSSHSPSNSIPSCFILPLPCFKPFFHSPSNIIPSDLYTPFPCLRPFNTWPVYVAPLEKVYIPSPVISPFFIVPEYFVPSGKVIVQGLDTP